MFFSYPLMKIWARFPLLSRYVKILRPVICGCFILIGLMILCGCRHLNSAESHSNGSLNREEMLAPLGRRQLEGDSNATDRKTRLPANDRHLKAEDLVGEAKMLLALLDLNNNGEIESTEVSGNARQLLPELDVDQNGVISTNELHRITGQKVPVYSKLLTINTYEDPDRIVELPDKINDGLSQFFTRYTNVLTPNGGAIHILAMDAWSKNRILRARKVLEHFLRDAPGRQWGNKTDLANTMANNHATLVLINSQENMDSVMPILEELDLSCQDLRANECPYEGESDYLTHQTRDAAYEEVFHLIHSTGIIHEMRDYDREIRFFAKQATNSGLWNYDEPNMLGSHFEYIICVYDNYLDLWSVKPTLMEGRQVGRQPNGQSFGGEYLADSRKSSKKADPGGFAMIEKFNPDHITYTAELAPLFQGIFSISGNLKNRYNEKAKHLRNVTLRGEKTGHIIGNEKDNRLVGNASNNKFTGGGGEDSLFGNAGEDTAIYRGMRSQYLIRFNEDFIEVHDSVVNRDGYDVLTGIERLQFQDQEISIDAFKQ